MIGHTSKAFTAGTPVAFKKFLDVIGNTTDGVYAVPGFHRIILWNPGTNRILGYSSQEVLGKLCYEAIAGGRQAAQAMDRHLGGSGDITEHLAPKQNEEMAYPPDLYPTGTFPFPQQELPRDQRAMTFEEVDLGLTQGDAMNEALRCIRCDLWRLQGVPPVWPKKRPAAVGEVA